MKVIDILNKRANNEEIPKKLKYGYDIFVLNVYSDEIGRLYVWDRNNDIGWLEREYITLNSEVEVIEDEKDTIKKLKEEVEELQKKLDEHMHDLLSHNGSPLILKTDVSDRGLAIGTPVDLGLKESEALELVNKIIDF